MLPTPDYAFFAERLHGFVAVAGDAGVTLTLTEVERSAHQRQNRQPFVNFNHCITLQGVCPQRP